jgi:hypothetical protein
VTRPNRYLFDEAIAAFCERSGRVIVEVGAIRNRRWRDTDGHSTLRWPTEALVWTVDADPAAVKLTRELTAGRSNVFCVLADAIAFLRTLPFRIDLLYLDGPHPDREDGRQWHFEAYQAAAMQHRAVLLIDDTDLPRLGKAEFVVPTALEDGFQVVASDRQTLLVR